jgi:hypothetical protein
MDTLSPYLGDHTFVPAGALVVVSDTVVVGAAEVVV